MKFFGELLIFVLLLLINGRVFLPKKGRQDPLVGVAPFTVILSFLILFSWGFDVYIGLNLILSILVFISNFHAMFRYKDKLYVDTYSSLMKIAACFTSILSIASIVFIIIFVPVIQNPKSIIVNPAKEKLTGSIRNGFVETGRFEPVNAIVYEYTLKEINDNSKNIVLFLPDRRADVVNYEPYLQSLAKKGCKILTADFYTDDYKYLHNSGDNRYFRRFFLVLASVMDNQNFVSQREFYTYNMSLEAEALLKLGKEKYGSDCKFFFISDVMGNTAVSDLKKMHEEEICGVFALDSIPEYNTPGYGCVEQTDILLAKILGTKRDSEMFYTKFLAKKSSEAAFRAFGE